MLRVTTETSLASCLLALLAPLPQIVGIHAVLASTVALADTSCMAALSDTAPQDLGYTGGTHMGELPPTIYGQEHLGANGSHASATRPGTRAGGLGREPSREKGGGEEGILRTPSRPSTAARRRAELHAKARVQKLMLQEITDHQQLVLASRQIRKVCAPGPERKCRPECLSSSYKFLATWR